MSNSELFKESAYYRSAEHIANAARASRIAASIKEICQHCNQSIVKASIKKHVRSCYLNPTNIKYCLHCSSIISTPSSRIFCCKSCAAKYNNRLRETESRQKQRISLLKRYGKELKDIPEFVEYRKQCAFRFDESIYPRIKGYDKGKFLLHAIEDGSTSAKAITKDHRYSALEGFINKVDPSIIAHPANCEFLTRLKNSRKGPSCSITLEQLLEEIKNWT